MHLLAAVQAEAELKRLGQVYGVYAEHADNVRQYSQQLWADLDITRMVSGTDEVAKKLRGLTALKMLPVYEAVEKEIQGFKNSLPLMRDLKNEALRMRHWDQLMAVTGVNTTETKERNAVFLHTGLRTHGDLQLQSVPT